MNTNKASAESFALLSQAILNLDPGALVGLSPEDGPRNAAAGMNEFMRKLILRTLSLLYAADDYVIELFSADPSKECDAKIHNLIELFSWALIRLPRALRHRGELAVSIVNVRTLELPEKRTSRSTTDQLVRGATAIIRPAYDAIRNAPGPQDRAISFCALIAKLLDIKPEALIRQYYDTPAAAQLAFEQDPEGQAVAGLSAMLTKILFDHQALTKMTDDGDVLAFKMYACENDAGLEGAGSNLAALLTAGFFVGSERKVAFIT
jgi:hypothetical protein